MRNLLFLIIFIFLAASAHAQESSASASRLLEEKPRFLAGANARYFPILQANHRSGHLTVSDIERVKVVKTLLDGIDTKSLQETIDELEKTRHPQINLQIMEAMAKTYTDIVKEIDVKGQKKKEWLYSMVCLNMAYLQFGGSQGTSGSTSSLNRFIRQKLRQYLPLNALKQQGFLYSLE